MIRYLPSLVLLLFTGCGGSGPSNPSAAYSPVVIIHMRDVERSPLIPWEMSSGRDDISACMLIPSAFEEPRAFSTMVREASDAGLLVAVVTDRSLSASGGPDDMLVRTDGGGAVHTDPAALREHFPEGMDLGEPSSHDLLRGMCEVYMPDLILIDISPGGTGAVLEIAAGWTSPEVLSMYTVVIFSLPGDPSRRGWSVFAGGMINGTTPKGLDAGGLLSTVRLLTGLKWMDDIPGMVPAVSIFRDPQTIWSIR